MKGKVWYFCYDLGLRYSPVWSIATKAQNLIAKAENVWQVTIAVPPGE
jgi:hypothetical protein